MKHLIKKPAHIILMTLFFGMILAAPIKLISVADAHHKPGHVCEGGGQSGCGATPPTVDELPIKYMVPGGFALVLITGGIVYLVRNRGKKHSMET